MAHKYARHLATGHCSHANGIGDVPCARCPFRHVPRCVVGLLHKTPEIIPTILKDEATYRLWCEIEGVEPNTWIEEE